MKIKFTFFIILISFLVHAQMSVKGKVVDEFDNPIPFVNVAVQGTTCGTTTDDDGDFSFRCEKNKGILEVSFVGFQTQTFKINTRTKPLSIVLKEGADVLDEVVVVSRPKKRLKKKENPAYKFLKEFWKRKRTMGIGLVENYQFKKHSSVEVGLNNLDTTFIKTLFKEQYSETMKEIKYDSDGVNYYIPVFMSEQISKVYGNNKLKKVRTDIEAEKQEGLGAQGFVFDRMVNTFKRIDVFKNDITILGKSFVSPFSTDGFATYDYVLYDSISKNNKKLYNIYFFPIRNADYAFQGNFWLADKDFSVEKLRMKVTKDANLNFVRGLAFEKEFEVKSDSIYLSTKDKYEGDFTFLDKNDNNKGLTIKQTDKFTNYNLTKKYHDSFYDIEKQKVRPDQYVKGEEYWEVVDNKENESTYKLIKSVKSKRKIKSLTGTINVLASGFIKLPKIPVQTGSLWISFAYNEVEGFRTRLGLRTFKTKDDRFRMKGHLAYGFKDEKIKYGVEGRYLLSFEPRISTSLAYQDDIEQLGSVLLNTSQLLGRSFGSVAVFSRGTNYFLSDIKKIATNIDYAVHNNFHFGMNLSKSTIKSATTDDNFSIKYVDDYGNIQSEVVDVASEFYISYTPRRWVYGLGVEQRFGREPYPALTLNLRHGHKGVFGGTHEYDKIQFQYKHPILLGKYGITETTIEGGKTFGKVPLTLLSPIPANQSYSLVKNTFALMNYYDYITDTYASAHIEHHFNGFILNRIPLLKKLKLRSLVTFRTVYGEISDENKAINRSNITYNAPTDKMYYEYGFGLENIGYGNFRFLRFDAIWRSDYTPSVSNVAKPTPKFAIRLGVNVGI